MESVALHIYIYIYHSNILYICDIIYTYIDKYANMIQPPRPREVRQADGTEVYEGTQMGIYDDNPVKAVLI